MPAFIYTKGRGKASFGIFNHLGGCSILYLKEPFSDIKQNARAIDDACVHLCPRSNARLAPLPQLPPSGERKRRLGRQEDASSHTSGHILGAGLQGQRTDSPHLGCGTLVLDRRVENRSRCFLPNHPRPEKALLSHGLLGPQLQC